MSPFDKLINHFEKFPGVGARQARRFAYHILSLPEPTTEEIANTIRSVRNTVHECADCRRFFISHGGQTHSCDICYNENRDRTVLLVVASDSDVTAIERSNMFSGLYFVLGGTLSLLSPQETKRLRANGLKKIITERITNNSLQEIILGLPVNPDGENTARYVETLIKSIAGAENIKISYLGRGLSTGSELEYADTETIKNALLHRT